MDGWKLSVSILTLGLLALLLVACSGQSVSAASQSQSSLSARSAPSPTASTPAPAVQTPYSGGMGPGTMRGGYGPGATPYNANGSPVTMDQAVTIANQYLTSTGYTNLQTAHIHEFTNGFEAEYVEKGSDVHAFEILIDKYPGGAFFEMGPNTMWNTKYSPMASGMGRPSVAATTTMPVSVPTAKTNAQAWLQSNLTGATLGSDVDTAYGYYEMEVDQGGKPYGELDVNGYTGQVWYENWHGPMVQTRELISNGH